MSQPIRAVVIGAGDRGHKYSQYALVNPSALTIVATAEPRAAWRESMATAHHIPADHCFSTWQALLAEPCMADVAIITLPDRLHHDAAIAAMQGGYHVLLEKPMSPLLEENRNLIRVAEASGQLLQICHVLRYTAFFRKVREIVQSGALGRVVHVDHKENVVFWHMAHSFVRGNWRNESLSGPMILTKCCHDLDILNWILGVPVVSLSSYGELTHYTAAHKPTDAPTHCALGCPVAETCLYDAVRFYAHDRTGWPYDIVARDADPATRLDILKTSPYGRCVYQCDNDVVDHQVVNMLLEDGTTVTLTMQGHAEEDHRSIRYEGTHATLVGKFSKLGNRLVLHDHLSGQETIFDVEDANPSGHGGGDFGLIESFINAVHGKPDASLTTARQSLESHLLAFAAEESRHNRQTIEMATFRQD